MYPYARTLANIQIHLEKYEYGRCFMMCLGIVSRYVAVAVVVPSLPTKAINAKKEWETNFVEKANKVT